MALLGGWLVGRDGVRHHARQQQMLRSNELEEGPRELKHERLKEKRSKEKTFLRAGSDDRERMENELNRVRRASVPESKRELP